MVRGRVVAGWIVALQFALIPHPSGAQSLEIAPFGGYRFGGDLYEVITGTPLDIDGAPSFGATLDIFLSRGTSVSFLYSRQETRVEVGNPPGQEARRVTLAVDHWHVGGTQEFGEDVARPLLTASLGLTRFGNSYDSEVRFSLAGGGGVKLMPSRHVGIRLAGRVYAVFVDGDSTGSICAPGVCVIGLDVSVVWQAEFAAGLVLAF